MPPHNTQSDNCELAQTENSNAAAAQLEEQPATHTRPRRWRRYVIVFVALSGTGFLYYHAFCNVPLHSEAWTRERIGPAIVKGFEYLYEAGTFGKSVEDGGESPPHHFFLELVLARHDHPGLRRQMAHGRELNDANWQWRTFFGMPGWPRHKLTSLDRTRIEYAVDHGESNFYAEWLLHGLYPSWTKLRPEEEARLFVDTSKLGHSYYMTHALLMYLWMKRVDPAVAETRNIDRLIRDVSERLYVRQSWDPCTSDIYNERVAFFLYMDDPPPIKRRWIERILLSQNVDGGWSFDKSIGRTLGQFVGYDPGTQQSYAHGTFLALYALSEYQAGLEEEEKSKSRKLEIGGAGRSEPRVRASGSIRAATVRERTRNLLETNDEAITPQGFRKHQDRSREREGAVRIALAFVLRWL